MYNETYHLNTITLQVLQDSKALTLAVRSATNYTRSQAPDLIYNDYTTAQPTEHKLVLAVRNFKIKPQVKPIALRAALNSSRGAEWNKVNLINRMQTLHLGEFAMSDCVAALGELVAQDLAGSHAFGMMAACEMQYTLVRERKTYYLYQLERITTWANEYLQPAQVLELLQWCNTYLKPAECDRFHGAERALARIASTRLYSPLEQYGNEVVAIATFYDVPLSKLCQYAMLQSEYDELVAQTTAQTTQQQ
jgi:hypothetical protein